MNNLPPLTEEQKQLAQAARREKILAGESLRHNWADLDHWRMLAKSMGTRLPQSYQPATSTNYIRKIAKKVDIDIKEWVESTGCTNLAEINSLNPNIPAYVMTGWFLEYADEVKSGQLGVFPA
jgi:hypothetical protein